MSAKLDILLRLKDSQFNQRLNTAFDNIKQKSGAAFDKMDSITELLPGRFGEIAGSVRVATGAIGGMGAALTIATGGLLVVVGAITASTVMGYRKGNDDGYKSGVNKAWDTATVCGFKDGARHMRYYMEDNVEGVEEFVDDWHKEQGHGLRVFDPVTGTFLLSQKPLDREAQEELFPGIEDKLTTKYRDFQRQGGFGDKYSPLTRSQYDAMQEFQRSQTQK